MRTEISAGGIIFRKLNNSIKVLMILDSFGKWTFPKGHVEKNEIPEESALRESQEEIGLKDLSLCRFIDKTDFWFVDKWEHKGEKIHKIVYWYLIESTGDLKPSPQLKEIKDAKWFDVNEIEIISDYKDNKILIQKIRKELM